MGRWGVIDVFFSWRDSGRPDSGLTARRTEGLARAAGLLVVVLVLFAPLLLAPLPGLAQTPEELRRQAEQMLGRPISDEEIVQRLRESGLSADEIRQRIESRGMDPSLAEPYLAVLEGRAESVPSGTSPMSLLQVMSEFDGGEPSFERVDSTFLSRRFAREMAKREESGPPIFGRKLFQRLTYQFEPVNTGPVPPDYRIGPGDELILVLTGGVEQAYQLTVSRQGWVVVPDVGRIQVNGLTLEQLEGAFFHRLGQVYSGIREGPEANTFFDVSIGRLRTNQIYVIGEAESPSAYAVSSLTTVMGALYEAGGPNENGSFREVLVNRGGRTIARVDLYDYLLRGDASQDVRLEQGDIVFVPMVERRVEVDGAVMRPGLYELKEGETLADLIRFAGGVAPNADLRRVQIQRILPDGDRGPGLDRAAIDVTLTDGGREVSIRGGDRVTVFAVLEEVSNEVTVSGAVWQPGTYAVEPGTTLWQMIERAGGLLPDAVESRVQIQRLDRNNWVRRMIPVSLERGPDGRPLEDPEVHGLDQILVHAKRDLREGRVVSIGGWVQRPGVYPYAEGMTVRDLILRAGGLRSGAYLDHVDVSRVVVSQNRTDSLTRRFPVPLDSSYVFDSGLGTEDGAYAELPAGSGASPPADPFQSVASESEDGASPPQRAGAPGQRVQREFALRNLDAVFVRKAPGFEPQQTVVVSGEVLLPGPYALETRGERLTDLIDRAGGLTPEAYAEGLQLWRPEEEVEPEDLTAVDIAGRSFGSDLSREERRRLNDVEDPQAPLSPIRNKVKRTRVGMDFPQAMRRPEGPHNILVEPNDSIFVPRYIPTVQVAGAVGVPTKVLYRDGAGLGYYIGKAGGYADNADKKRTRVRLANGEVHTRGGKFLVFGGSVPQPDPGATITVPEKPERERGGMPLGQVVGILTSVMTATATVIIATR